MAAQDKRSSHYAKGRTNYPSGLIYSRKPNNSRTRQLISLLTHQLVNSKNHKITNAPTHQLTNSQTHKLDNSLTRQHTNLSTCQLINLPTHKLTNSKTQKLKFVIFILQNYSNFHPILAKKWGVKWVNWQYFQLFTSLTLSIFKHKTCILHHFAFLVWLPTHYFLRPITPFQHLKTPLFNGHFALFSPIFDESKRLCSYHCSVFLCVSLGI